MPYSQLLSVRKKKLFPWTLSQRTNCSSHLLMHIKTLFYEVALKMDVLSAAPLSAKKPTQGTIYNLQVYHNHISSHSPNHTAFVVRWNQTFSNAWHASSHIRSYTTYAASHKLRPQTLWRMRSYSCQTSKFSLTTWVSLITKFQEFGDLNEFIWWLKWIYLVNKYCYYYIIPSWHDRDIR